MLVVYHNIYDAQIFPVGHADGEENLLSVTVHEVEEATGDTIVDLIKTVHKRLIKKLNVKESTIYGKFFF